MEAVPDRPCEAVIDLGALAHNFGRARELAAGRALYPVIKADAYGHGAVPVARALLRAGADRLAVVSSKEGAELRAAGIEVPVLVLGGVSGLAEAETAIAHRLTPVVHDRPGADLLADVAGRLGRPVRVHVEVDTGMRRMGVPAAEAVDLLDFIVAGSSSKLELEGVYTHFACADDQRLDASLRQIEIFRDVLSQARERGIHPDIIHADNSAALFQGEALSRALPQANAARPGLMLYGAAPAEAHEADDNGLRPVMTLCAALVATRDVAAGDSVGYGATHHFAEASRVGTAALGYADGVPVALGAEGVVCVRGVVRRIVGRVSMDFIGIDLGRTGAACGDRVVLFGDPRQATGTVDDTATAAAHETEGDTKEDALQRARAMSVEAQARRAGTIAYELLVRVGARVPRRYIGGD